jgi:GDPmannose 4,6-dehydratase
VPVAIVTGITGQTGGYLAEQLLADGWAVHGVVRDADDAEPDLIARLPDAQLHSGNLENPSQMSALVAEIEPDAIFNLGGISSVAYSWEHPLEAASVTGFGPVALLDAAFRLRERTGRRVSLVQASSAEIFGAPTDVPQTESTPIAPVNPYGAAKSYAHHLVGVYRRRGLEATSCILYNHESPRRPEAFVTRKITSGVARIALGQASELVLGNLDAIRDWGWAPDYAGALVLAATGEPGDYVIATGVPHSVRDFVQTSFAVAGIDDWQSYVRTDPAFSRPVDAPVLVGDPSLAAAVLGWKPTTDFAQMVESMVAHDLEAYRFRA